MDLSKRAYDPALEGWGGQRASGAALGGGGEQRAPGWGGETTPVPQALRAAPPLERWRDPSQHPTGQTGTAQDLRVRLAVLGPAIPCLQGMGSSQARSSSPS